MVGWVVGLFPPGLVILLKMGAGGLSAAPILFLFHLDAMSRVLENSMVMHLNTPPVSIKIYTLTTCGYSGLPNNFSRITS